MQLSLSNAVGRRSFVQGCALWLGASVIDPGRVMGFDQNRENPLLRIGLITDMHYADKDPAGTRYYKESLGKLAEAANHFEKDPIDFVVELGDLIDAASSVEAELSYLNRINREFSAISKHRHYVLGNHCVDTLSKREFLEGVGQQRSYYSFDAGSYHFVILDSCFRSDGRPYERKNFEWTDANIPADEIDWLRADLKATPHRTIVFAHQRLDATKQHSVKNAAEVRQVIERSEKVLAVFQGHSHQNEHTELAGTHYCTLRAMVEGSGAESNAYSRLEIFAGDLIRVQGFRKQQGYEWDTSAG
jgi:alkaline phosphatase